MEGTRAHTHLPLKNGFSSDLPRSAAPRSSSESCRVRPARSKRGSKQGCHCQFKQEELAQRQPDLNSICQQMI